MPSETTAGNSTSPPTPRAQIVLNGGRSRIAGCACVRPGVAPYMSHCTDGLYMRTVPQRRPAPERQRDAALPVEVAGMTSERDEPVPQEAAGVAVDDRDDDGELAHR